MRGIIGSELKWESVSGRARGSRRDAIDHAFDQSPAELSKAGEDRVLFQIEVTPRLIRRSDLGLLLSCHNCYRWLQEFLQDLLGIPVSIGTIHNSARQATERARLLNAREDLSRVRIGAHDEIFQNSRPALVRRLSEDVLAVQTDLSNGKPKASAFGLIASRPTPSPRR